MIYFFAAVVVVGVVCLVWSLLRVSAISSGEIWEDPERVKEEEEKEAAEPAPTINASADTPMLGEERCG
jgi:hypothetical protein